MKEQMKGKGKKDAMIYANKLRRTFESEMKTNLFKQGGKDRGYIELMDLPKLASQYPRHLLIECG